MSKQAVRPEIKNPLVRIAGQSKPAHQVLCDTFNLGIYKLEALSVQKIEPDNDYAQVDTNLIITPPNEGDTIPIPHPSLGYAGLTPEQRYLFLQWLQQPTATAPLAFQNLYLAHLETNLIQQNNKTQDTLLSLQYLQSSSEWRDNQALSRAILLGLWLLQDGKRLSAWIAQGFVHVNLFTTAVGHLALLREKTTPALLRQLLKYWIGIQDEPSSDIMTMRLSSLQETLGQELLAYGLEQLSNDEKKPRPWRCAHRDLRFAVPQPNLRLILEPYLHELAELTAEEKLEPMGLVNSKDVENRDTEEEMPEDVWQLVLEFGHSRSEYFDYVLHQAKKRPGFRQLMDEDRNMVYRLIFHKREIRHFWVLWDYVQNWSTVHVYLRGEELEKWKIWPYSQYLR
ncbi:hypothetical protein KFU94_34500 [Chloroflexi bacterium TSY]|nr:hypothetical protein [Chloroflexi bacterium TSY]